MSKRFMIYADGGSKVCLGHIMRTLTLANAMRIEGVDVIFATSSIDAIPMIEKEGFTCVSLNELNYEVLAQKAVEHGARGVLVDKFGFTLSEHELIKDKVGLLVHIDDFTYNGPADIVINTTLDNRPKDSGGSWLCGGKYAIIRESFINDAKSIADNVTNVLITTGYGDPSNCHLKCIDVLNNVLPSANIHVVVGGGYTNKKELRSLASESLHIYENVTDISDLMHMCDIAITSAGTTLYEMAAAGLPAIAFSLYDNQIDNIARVSEKGCIVSLGWHEELTLKKIEMAIDKLANNKELRLRLSRAGRTWIDGKGASRIAKHIKARL